MVTLGKLMEKPQQGRPSPKNKSTIAREPFTALECLDSLFLQITSTDDTPVIKLETLIDSKNNGNRLIITSRIQCL